MTFLHLILLVRGDNCLRIKKLFVGLVVIVLLTIMGCTKTEDQDTHLYKRSIHVYKHSGDGDKYEEFRKLPDKEQVKKAKAVLDQAQWQETKVDMARPADYQFAFEFKNPQNTTKPGTYQVWITLDNSQLEVMSAGDKYTKITKEQSAILFEVLTGEKLGDLK
jgi:hypothetical protein